MPFRSSSRFQEPAGDVALVPMPVSEDSTLEGTNAVQFSTVGWAIGGGVAGAVGGYFIGACVGVIPIVGGLASAASWGITGAVAADTAAGFAKKNKE
uniref:Uncharacterized protein n=1 Tax=Eutreptiella gymnastica TaxID=73025 RepID=A0A7S4G2N1_9EUGL